MGIEFTDTFGPFLQNLRGDYDSAVDGLMARTAFELQKRIVIGLRRQKYSSLWAPLSPRYLASKVKRNTLILVNTGDMSTSIEVTRHGPASYEVGTNHPAARAHEFGYVKRNLPARPFMRPALEDSIDAISDLWRAQFINLINGWST